MASEIKLLVLACFIINAGSIIMNAVITDALQIQVRGLYHKVYT
jgi:hypothetical protein